MPKRIEYEGTIHEFPDDFTDQDIAKALQSAPAAGAGQTPAPQNTPAERFRRSAWEKLDPAVAIEGLKQASTQPLTFLQGLALAQGSLLGKSVQSFREGQYARALAQGMHGLLPLVGPELEAARENLEQGNYPEAFGSMAGMATGFLAPKALGKIPEVRAGIPGMNALNPARRAAIDYLESKNVPMSAGQVGGGFLVRGAEKLAGVSPLGAQLAPQMEMATEAGVGRVARELADRAHPRMYTPLTAGESVTGALGRRAGKFEKQAGIEYQVLDDAAQDPQYIRSVQQGTAQDGSPIMQDVAIPVDTAPFRVAAKDLYDHMKLLTSSARRHSSDAFAALEGLMNSPRYIPASVAEEILGTIKEMTRTTKGRDAGRARFLVNKFQPVVDDAVGQADPNILTSLQEARGWTAKQKGTERVLQRVSGVAKEPSELAMIREPEPVAAYGKLTQPRDAKLRLIQSVERETPAELPKLGRAKFEEIFSILDEEGITPGSTRKMEGLWKAMGPETKRKFYPDPIHRGEVGLFLRGLRELAMNPNPSGTALTNAIQAQLVGIPTLAMAGRIGEAAAAATIPSALASLMYTRKGVQLMRAGLRIPAGDIARKAAWASQVGHLLTDEEKIRNLMERTGKTMLPYEYATPPR